MSTGDALQKYGDRVKHRLELELDDEARTEIGWFLLAVPKLFAFSTILLGPFVMAIYISFFQWDPLLAERPFVGLDNYVRLFNDPLFHNSIINSAGYSLGQVFVGIPIALFLALLLDQDLRGTKFYSAAIFLPVVTSWVVVSLIWTLIYNPEFGLLNSALEAVGLPTLGWLRDTRTAMASITMMSIWKQIGFNMVIFLAGLQSIPDSYYEAARIDGANSFQRARYITLPLLKSTTFFVVIVTLATSFRVFTQIFVMTDGGPINSTYTVVYYLFQKGFTEFQMGYASAMAVVLFVIVVTLSIAQQYSWGEDVEY